MEHFDSIYLMGELASEDAEAAALISKEAGWNQTVCQWEAMIAEGYALGIRYAEDRTIIATAIVTPCDANYAWISMVLVRPEFRQRGLATELVKRCTSWSRSQHLTPLLDATRAGKEVYRRLGFRDYSSVTRMHGMPSLGSTKSLLRCSIRKAEKRDFPRLIQLDTRSLGFNRENVFRRVLCGEESTIYVSDDNGDCNGFVVKKMGIFAIHLGPIVAASGRLARSLTLRAIENNESDRVIIDVCDAVVEYRNWLSNSGFTVDRSFSRMIYGVQKPPNQSDTLVAIAGPELA